MRPARALIICGREARRERADPQPKTTRSCKRRLFLLFQPLELRLARRQLRERLVEGLQMPAIMACDGEDGRVHEVDFLGGEDRQRLFQDGQVSCR